MNDDIKLVKLDQISAAKPVSRQVRQDATESQTANPAPSSPESVTFSYNLGNFVQRMLADNQQPANNPHRVVELKRQIENNQYKVDVDALASTLAHTLAPTK